MRGKYAIGVGLLATAFVAGVAVGNGPLVKAQSKNRVLEIRTYTTSEGRLDALVDRMGHGESQAFERAGMQLVGFFVAAEAPRSQDTFVYILGHESRDAATKSWAKFREDPQWLEVRARSEAAGKVVAKTESLFVTPLDFSSLK